MGKVYSGDVLTQIILDAGTPLGTPDELKIKYKKPGGTTGEWDANVFEITKAKYIVKNGDLNESGMWIFQIYVELETGGWQGHGEEYKIRIHKADTT